MNVQNKKRKQQPNYYINDLTIEAKNKTKQNKAEKTLQQKH